ncbi:YciI family protein [Pseudoalteromonas fenneropenaei]|uniref:YciI family protein n=1 Tax=Pseudoalteromonas fenneropenaei TaxID=1737459 RepID=A0ABV7CIZ3_9GAMM
MFLVDMTFTDVSQITPELTEQHRNYLAKEYQSQNLLFGGRKEPRTGGILLSKHSNEATLKQVLDNDPFIKRGLVRYHITEFTPVMASTDYVHLLA